MNIATSHAASLHVRAGIGGEPVVADMQASGPMAFQAAPWGVWLVNSSAHPVGGDNLELKVTIDVGTCLDIRSFSPTVAKPGKGTPRNNFESAASSSSHTTVNVASDAMLSWCPEPGIATQGSQHLNDSLINLASNARLAWREEYLLDRRSGLQLGSWCSRLRVVRDGWPVVASQTTLGPTSDLWESPVVLEGARSVSMFVVIDPSQDVPPWHSARGAADSATGLAMPLAGPGITITAWGDDLFACRALAEDLFEPAGIPQWARDRWHAANPPRAADRSLTD